MNPHKTVGETDSKPAFCIQLCRDMSRIATGDISCMHLTHANLHVCISSYLKLCEHVIYIYIYIKLYIYIYTPILAVSTQMEKSRCVCICRYYVQLSKYVYITKREGRERERYIHIYIYISTLPKKEQETLYIYIIFWYRGFNMSFMAQYTWMYLCIYIYIFNVFNIYSEMVSLKIGYILFRKILMNISLSPWKSLSLSCVANTVIPCFQSNPYIIPLIICG